MHPLLELFIDFAEKEGFTTNSFIVGGAVRDILLGKELKDIDIAVKGDAIDVAKRFADKINASFVLMDKEFAIARVVQRGKRQKTDSYFIDICMMRGNTIYDDLRKRDITINAMAMPLASQKVCDFLGTPLSKVRSKIIDPYGGRNDLFNKIIKMVSEENLIKDPLRIIRIYRFAAALNFSIEKNTLDATKRLAPLITSVAMERIAEELRYIIRLNNSYKTMKALMDNKILANIFPDVRINSLKLYKDTEEILGNLSDSLGLSALSLQPLIKYFEIAYKKICLKLSTLFYDPNAAKQSAIELKMSRKEVEFIHKMVVNRSKILNCYRKMLGITDETEIIELLKVFRDDVYSLIILTIAQKPSTAEFCKEMIKLYENVFKPRAALLPIITGNDIMNTFNLKPSPMFKEILAAIEDLVLKGKITSNEEALKVVKKMIDSTY
ncbi:[cytidine(C)-cytidine(C)-adenosine (A)]-adding enzyme [hot springs metagenome]|uniref:[cytidine(C)-cytidine(C)-adenosine (A)]-adding enzyme n=1 Tax=hot springs metagenome TaxID=433727 RepID=A0A5J4KT59_9ZZZZ